MAEDFKPVEANYDEPGNAYVDMGADGQIEEPLTEVDEVVIENMPDDERVQVERERRNTGFGQEPEVIINTSGDPMDKYK